jgi:hypothetical protein
LSPSHGFVFGQVKSRHAPSFTLCHQLLFFHDFIQDKMKRTVHTHFTTAGNSLKFWKGIAV